jgi:hypothetical protein
MAPIAMPAIAPPDKDAEEGEEVRVSGGDVVVRDRAESDVSDSCGSELVGVEVGTEVVRAIDMVEEMTWKPSTFLSMSPVIGFISAALSHVSTWGLSRAHIWLYRLPWVAGDIPHSTICFTSHSWVWPVLRQGKYCSFAP